MLAGVLPEEAGVLEAMLDKKAAAATRFWGQDFWRDNPQVSGEHARR